MNPVAKEKALERKLVKNIYRSFVSKEKGACDVQCTCSPENYLFNVFSCRKIRRS